VRCSLKGFSFSEGDECGNTVAEMDRPADVPLGESDRFLLQQRHLLAPVSHKVLKVVTRVRMVRFLSRSLRVRNALTQQQCVIAREKQRLHGLESNAAEAELIPFGARPRVSKILIGND